MYIFVLFICGLLIGIATLVTFCQPGLSCPIFLLLHYILFLFLKIKNLRGLCSLIGCSYSYDSSEFEALFLIYFAHSLVMSAVLVICLCQL